MANEPQKVDGGIFIDTQTNEVVHEKPEEGVQVVPEGGVVDELARGLLQAEGHQLETASAEEDVETADDKTVTTKSVKGK